MTTGAPFASFLALDVDAKLAHFHKGGIMPETKPLDLMGLIIEYEMGSLDEDKVIELFQGLVSTGLAWKLQGSYGRAARAMIDAGLISG